MGVSICLMLSAIAVHASTGTIEYDCYPKGVFISVDFALGVVLNERAVDRDRNSSSGTDVSIGYRFAPQFAIAVGSGAHGYSNWTWTCGDTVPRKVENTCVPVFIRVRSDLSDKEVTPYLQMDLGYSFMGMYTRESLGRVKYALDNFTNGRSEYIEVNDSYIQYGSKGFFGAVDLGVALHVIGPLRLNIGLSVGIHQAFLGTAYLSSEGESLNFGRVECLPSNGEQVRIVGDPPMKDSLEPFIKVKMGFSF